MSGQEQPNPAPIPPLRHLGGPTLTSLREHSGQRDVFLAEPRPLETNNHFDAAYKSQPDTEAGQAGWNTFRETGRLPGPAHLRTEGDQASVPAITQSEAQPLTDTRADQAPQHITRERPGLRQRLSGMLGRLAAKRTRQERLAMPGGAPQTMHEIWADTQRGLEGQETVGQSARRRGEVASAFADSVQMSDDHRIRAQARDAARELASAVAGRERPAPAETRQLPVPPSEHASLQPIDQGVLEGYTQVLAPPIGANYEPEPPEQRQN